MLRNICRRPFRLPHLTVRPVTTVAPAAVIAPPEGPPKIELRPYQKDCIEQIIAFIEKKRCRLGISLATGSGKTVVFTNLISRIKPPSDLAQQTMIIAHKRELVEQAANHSRASYPDYKVEIEMADEHASGNAEITVASIQSLASNARYAKFKREKFKLILLDECHHAVAPSYLKVLEHFGVLDPDGDGKGAPYVVGVTATMSRLDGKRLNKVMDYVAYHLGFVEMIRDNWLAPLKLTTVKAPYSLPTAQGRKDYNLQELSRRVNTDNANDAIVRSWFQKAKERRSTIVFCIDISHVINMTRTFRKYGIDARPITHMTAPEARKERLQAFKDGKIQVLVNCGIFTEGVDVPNIDCVVLARPTRSKNLVVQMIGRGMRLYPGKKDCYILDMVGDVDKDVVTVPTLFGLDPEAVIENETVEGLEKMAEEAAKKAEELRVREAQVVEQPLGRLIKNVKAIDVEFTDYDSMLDFLNGSEPVFDLSSKHDHEKDIREMSNFAWVEAYLGRYILAQKGRYGFISIEKNPNGTFQAKEVVRIPSELEKGLPDTVVKPRIIVNEAATLSAAVKEADSYATTIFNKSEIETNAPWRHDLATKYQKVLVMRAKKNCTQEWLDNLKQGEAADIITRMKHGPSDQWKAAQKANKELEKKKKEEEKLQRKKEKEMEKDKKIKISKKLEEIKVGKLDF